MQSKLIGATAAGAVLIGGLVVTSLAGAQSAPLSVSCSGAVSNNVIAWSAVATGGTAPYTFLWSGDSQVAGSTSSAVTASYVANGTYTAFIQARDSASSTATATSSCSRTVTSIVTSTSTPTSTPPLPPPFIMRPTLHIEGNGEFLARGMRVTSIGTGSFQGQVWGVTYTINWSGSLNDFSEFWFRFNQANPTSTIPTQLAVGDEVSVSGRIDLASPLIVTARVVRDFSITTPRRFHEEDDEDKNKDEHENEDRNEHEKGDRGDRRGGQSGGQSNEAITNRLNELFQQLRKLQDLFQARTGGN